MGFLKIENLHTVVEDKEILKGLSLTVNTGELHVLMGPNGAGKSTLGHVLMGNSAHKVTQGEASFAGLSLWDLSVPERAKKGLFLAFQHPVVISGLRLSEYLRNLYCLRHNVQIDVSAFRKIALEYFALLGLNREFLGRGLNEGLSGGEMKRVEMLQCLLLQPRLAVLDEMDSGVDLDAQKILLKAIAYAQEKWQTAFIVVSHASHFVNQLPGVHQVHILKNGVIERSGHLEILEQLDRSGFEAHG